MTDYLLTSGPLKGEIVDDELWLIGYSLDSLKSLMEDPDDGVDGDKDGLYYLFLEWCDRFSVLPSNNTLRDWVIFWKSEEIK